MDITKQRKALCSKTQHTATLWEQQIIAALQASGRFDYVEKSAYSIRACVGGDRGGLNDCVRLRVRTKIESSVFGDGRVWVAMNDCAFSVTGCVRARAKVSYGKDYEDVPRLSEKQLERLVGLACKQAEGIDNYYKSKEKREELANLREELHSLITTKNLSFNSSVDGNFKLAFNGTVGIEAIKDQVAFLKEMEGLIKKYTKKEGCAE